MIGSYEEPPISEDQAEQLQAWFDDGDQKDYVSQEIGPRPDIGGAEVKFIGEQLVRATV